jgi:hypothetical protein
MESNSVCARVLLSGLLVSMLHPQGDSLQVWRVLVAVAVVDI